MSMEPEIGADDPIIEWARERLANTSRISREKTGRDRAGWLEDESYWAAIVVRLEHHLELSEQSPEIDRRELRKARQRVEELERYRATAEDRLLVMKAARERINELEAEVQRERDRAQAIIYAAAKGASVSYDMLLDGGSPDVKAIRIEKEKLEPGSNTLAWTIRQCDVLARRELRRHAQKPTPIDSVGVERWMHVKRLCEEVGISGEGVLRKEDAVSCQSERQDNR